MAGLEAKLLDGPSAGYCSSSDEEEDGGFKTVNNEDEHQANVMRSLGGYQQTGPKGVLQDFKDYHDNVARQKHMRDAAILSQAERGMFQSSKEEREKANKSSDEDDDLGSLLMKRRLEMKKILSGKIIELTKKEQLLDITENSDYMVGLLIYEPGVEECDHATRLCKILSAEYENVKFARATSTLLGMSEGYKSGGVPTLQFYAPGGQLAANFVRFTDRIGQDYSIEKLKKLIKKHHISLKQSRVVSDSECSSDEA